MIEFHTYRKVVFLPICLLCYQVLLKAESSSLVAIRFGERVRALRGHATTGQGALGRQGTEPVIRASEDGLAWPLR